MNEVRFAGWFALVVGLGCGADPQETGRAALSRGEARLGGAVVSTVNGHPITLAEVEAAARLGEVSPEVALRRLEDELLLTLAAERAGSDEGVDRAHTRRQAAVQHLLAHDIEGTVDAVDDEGISASEVLQLMHELRQPERRGSVHLVAMVGRDAPPTEVALREQWIREQWQAVAAADDPESAILAYRRRTFPDLPFEVSAEDVPPIPRDGAEPAYVDELFGIPEPGLVSEPFRTDAGVHIMVFTELLAAHEPTEEEARDTLVSRHLAQARADALGTLMTEIVTRAPVSIESAGARIVMQHQGLARGAP